MLYQPLWVVDWIKDKLNSYQLPAGIICFEIMGTVAISNQAKATRFMEELRSAGFQFAMDDFGSGVSSFGYLKNLPVDYLKIDGESVKDISTNRINRALVKSINEIGHIMGKKAIAEYVEDDRAVELLGEIGADYAHGYVFSRPVPL
ncbi:MAG: EAL domain-containing protein [Gammaproteobacteria bacterium]|nr:EAL domain-containing protein [Gammaproteobacteria bacterium]